MQKINIKNNVFYDPQTQAMENHLKHLVYDVNIPLLANAFKYGNIPRWRHPITVLLFLPPIAGCLHESTVII